MKTITIKKNVILLTSISALYSALVGASFAVPLKKQIPIPSTREHILSRRGPGTEDTQLLEKGYDSTPEGLKRALDSSDIRMKRCAIIVIRNQGEKSLLPEVKIQLTNSWCLVRVEAGMTLMKLGDPKGARALRKEVERCSLIVLDALNGNRTALGTIAGDRDVSDAVKAAGALADAGDSSAYTYVKTVIQSFPQNYYATTAALILPKFAKFENSSSDIKVRSLLIQAADSTIKAVEATKAQGKEDEYRSRAGAFMVIARSLAEVGGPEARAKLLQATNHADPKVREHAKTFLNKLDQKSPPAGSSGTTP